MLEREWRKGNPPTLSHACTLSHFSHVLLFATLWTIACQGLLSMGFPSENPGVGCYFFIEGIFPTQRWNQRLLHWQAHSLPLSHQGSPVIDLVFMNKYNGFMYLPLFRCLKMQSKSYFPTFYTSERGAG